VDCPALDPASLTTADPIISTTLPSPYANLLGDHVRPYPPSRQTPSGSLGPFGHSQKHRRRKNVLIPYLPVQPSPNKVSCSHANRHWKRKEGTNSISKLRAKHVGSATPVHVEFNTDDMLEATSGYLGQDTVNPEDVDPELGAEHFVGPGSTLNFTLVKARVGDR
jgi:hypothetical protein